MELTKGVFYDLPKAVMSHMVRSTKYNEFVGIFLFYFKKKKKKKLNAHHNTSLLGQTIEDYASSLNSKTKVSGNYNFFSGSVSVDFQSNTVTNNQVRKRKDIVM